MSMDKKKMPGGTEQVSKYDAGEKLQNLRKWNIIAFVAFAVIACVFGGVVGSAYDPDVVGISTELYVVRRKVEKVGGTGRLSVSTVAEKQADHTPWLLFALVVLFMAGTATGHLGVATCLRGTYESDLREKGYNKFRWIEYSITSAVMLVVLAFSLGCRELWALAALLVMNVLMMYCGFVAECNLAPGRISKKRAWLAWWMGTFLFAFIWLYLGTGFSNVLKDTEEIRKERDDQLPEAFFFALFWALLVLYALFGFVQFWHIRKIREEGEKEHAEQIRFRVEWFYILLSFLSKATLAGLLIWGLYGRNQAASKNQAGTVA